MRAARSFRICTGAAVIAWKLTALALLPAALCGRAVMAAEGTAAPACCAGGGHGAMCPMKRDGRSDGTDAGQTQPRMLGCNSLDDALVGMIGLTGFHPDAFEFTSDPMRSDRVA